MTELEAETAYATVEGVVVPYLHTCRIPEHLRTLIRLHGGFVGTGTRREPQNGGVLVAVDWARLGGYSMHCSRPAKYWLVKHTAKNWLMDLPNDTADAVAMLIDLATSQAKE